MVASSVRRVLEFNHPERQAVDEQHDIRAAFVIVFDDRELVDRQPVVIGGNIEVDHAGLRATDGAVIRAILDRHTLYQHPVESPVTSFQRCPFRPVQLAKGTVECLGGQIRVQLSQGIPQPTFQNHLPVVGTLGSKRIGRNVRTVHNGPAETFQPGKRGVLDHGFGNAGRAHRPSGESRLRSDFSARATIFTLLAFRASSSAVSKSFRASSLWPNAAFVVPRLL